MVSKGWLDTMRVMAAIAVRNLVASRLKTVIVGGIIFFGSVLVVAGNSLLDSLDMSMSRSVIGSAAGHIQVYNAESKDELEILGGMSMGDPDLQPLDDFARVKAVLAAVPNVKAVIPMGISGAMVTSGNTIDIALAKLRDGYRKKLAGDTSPALLEQIQSQKDYVRQIMIVLEQDMRKIRTLLDERSITEEESESVRRAASKGFWDEFDKDPLDNLEFLENKLSTLAADADMLFLRYVGTDVQAFAKAFDRMQIVDGTIIPAGQRGFLFSKFIYEEQLKLKNARRLDRMKEEMDEQGSKIATDLDLQRMVGDNKTQVREIVLQLDAAKTRRFKAKLQQELGRRDEDVSALLAAFFDMNDGNFAHRYRFFYDQLAPDLDLYRVRVGDMLTIKAFTRSGYVQSINVRVYGTFEFAGLEKSILAGALNIMDLVSFRELYGFMTAEKREEIKRMKAASGAADIDRARAEQELFGTRAAEEPAAEAEPAQLLDLKELAGAVAARRQAGVAAAFPPEEVGHGVFLNAAVIVENPKKIATTIRDIEAAGQRAGLPLKAITWQKASGIIGQFITLARIVLYTAILIIFVIALVIINNALVMATLQRVQEIGTLRAIGAQRRFILLMLVFESLVVGALFGTIGAAAGAAIVGIVRSVGIPATSDIWYFFFSGPRLYPFLGTDNLVAAFVIVMLVSALSSLYPAWLAMKVSPRQAMQSEE